MLLVTGGAGFIGSNVVAALNEAGRADIVVNDLLGADSKWRLTPTQVVDAFVLASRSRAEEGGEASGGISAQVSYNYSTRAWGVAGSFEHYDEDGGPPGGDPSEGTADVDGDGDMNFVDPDNDARAATPSRSATGPTSTW